ncbi:MAG: glycoside hydrolase family 31 protein, partial [Herbiconiux sp.]|nr:glycoside hydrolase family 31 protein [Herbiconiux sp.]
ATLFARSASAGGQKFPVHWGGDSTSSFASMAETLRGGLSLAFSGFGYWSHDIGGFEGTPDPAVFKRWVAFGLLSSHSRLHASESYRVPWHFDTDESDEQSAVNVLRTFNRLKSTLMPYLLAAGSEAVSDGTPIMRPMLLEFPADPSVEHLDRQYMLGDALLVAPVFSAAGDVSYYLPSGRWYSLLTDSFVEGGGWVRETHDYTSVPLLLRPGSVVPMGAPDARPESAATVTLLVHPDAGLEGPLTVASVDGSFTVSRSGSEIVVEGPADRAWSVRIAGGETASAVDGTARVAVGS